MESTGTSSGPIIPHAHILGVPLHAVEQLSIEEKMRMVTDIRDFIGIRRDIWHAQGWAGDTVPPIERRAFEQAEEIGIRLFQGMGIPADYWLNSEAELARTLQRIADDSVMQQAARDWSTMTREAKMVALQAAVIIMAEEQSRHTPFRIHAGKLNWVENVPYQGNTSADYKELPQTYVIDLNYSDDADLRNDFDSAIKCALHEQTHIKQINYAHAWHVDSLPAAFNQLAQYFIHQPEAYVPSWRSDRLFAAQPCEQEALMATRSARVFILS